MHPSIPGPIALLGSGETLPSSGKTHETIAQRLPANPAIVILETPAGFEPNSDAVAGKIKSFLESRLQNFRPVIDVVPARRRDTPFSTEDPEILRPILSADEILLGPGSPTYAVRQLRGSLAYQMIAAKQRRGSALFLSSAAALAFGAATLPVYEIYKVGEDLHWKDGLDFFAPYGLSLTVIPHWNNRDGGEELDTSRCYMGVARFVRLLEMLPPGRTVIGIDEHTALVIDFKEGCCHVQGNSSVTILREGIEKVFRTGADFPIEILGDWHIPGIPQGVPADVWKAVVAAEEARAAGLAKSLKPSGEVLALVRERETARAERDWAAADRLRDRVRQMGWEIRDTPDGSEVSPCEEEK